MQKESLNITNIESLIEELSDEELAACSGGLLGGLLNQDIHTGFEDVDLPLRMSVEVLGLGVGLETDPSIRATTKAG